MPTAGYGAVSDALMAWVAAEEGFRAKPYRCAAGALTIGFGLNLDAGITREEAEWLLRHRLARIADELTGALPWWGRLDEVRRGVLLAMAYQLGVAGLLRFRRTLEAIEGGRYDEAADQMLRSRWAQQTPERARRTAEALRTGRWPEWR